MSFKTKLDNILEDYYKEYYRPLKYIDPRNKSKISDINLLDEHNQTVNFCNAIRKIYPESIAWYELSVGIKLPKSPSGRKSTEAIDGIVYIPEENTLLIIESKGLRKLSKFQDIKSDLERTLGITRNKSDIEKYIIQIEEKLKSVYAITLADIWGDKSDSNSDNWLIDFNNSKLTSREKCQVAYKEYKNIIKTNGILKTSNVHNIDGQPHRLLVMVYKMSKEEIATYTFN